MENAKVLGQYLIWFNETLKPDVRSRLLEMGYNVHETQSKKNETITKIKWF